jgi:hypothetical protein
MNISNSRGKHSRLWLALFLVIAIVGGLATLNASSALANSGKRACQRSRTAE